jgi:tetratricopeptide (TPR) repeat protein
VVTPRVLLVAAAALAAGCPRGSGSESSTPRDRPVTLAALADRIDPGRVPALLADPPPSVDRLMGERPADIDARVRADAEATLAAFAGQLSTGSVDASIADLQRILHLFHALAIVEDSRADRCDLACLTALERIYGILDIPWLAAEEGLMAEMVDIASAALVQSGMSKREVKEAIGYIRSVFRRAPERHAYIAARLFRRHPDSPAAQSALRRIGNRAGYAERFDEALQFLATAAARAPREERAGDLVELARVCYRALDLPCGDRHLAEARRAAGSDPAMAERLTGAAETARMARAVRSATGQSFEARVERAHLLLDLGRRKSAIALFEELRRARPKDARPLVGLAQGEMDTIRGARVRRYLGRASGLANRDRRYYELAVGTSFTTLMPLIQELAANPEMSEDQIVARLAALLAPLKADIDGLARFAPSRAAVLRVVIDGAVDVMRVRKQGDAALKAALARAWRAGLEVRRAHPNEPDAHHLVFLLVGADPAPRAELESAVLAAVPADLVSRDAVLLARAGIQLRMVMVGTPLEDLDRLAELVAAIPPSKAATWEARNLRADLAALSAAAGAASWASALSAYQELLPVAPDAPERARIENNIGVIHHRSGQTAEAQAAWDRAMRLGPAYPVPDLNHAATSDGAPYALQRLSDLAGSAELAGIGFQAAAWRRHFGAARGEKGQKSVAELRTEAFDDSFGLGTDGGNGFLAAGSFKISFGYHTSKRLVMELGTESRTWLCLPAPGTAGKP